MMGEDNIISIIIPAYNACDYIRNCLDSVINQTYKKLEIIVINDGSTDDTDRIIEEYQKKDSRIILISSANKGVSHARNLGLKKASGDYIAFVDADDWIEPDMYCRMMKQIIVDETDMCICGYKKYVDGKYKYNLKKGEKNIFFRERLIKEMFDVKSDKMFYWELWDKLFSKKCIDKYEFDESITHCEDMLMMWNILKNVKTASYLPSFSYVYVENYGSASHNILDERSLSAWQAIKLIKEDCSIKNESDIILECIDKRCFNMAVSDVRTRMILNFEKYKNDIVDRRNYIYRKIFKKNYCSSLHMKQMMLCFYVVLMPIKILRITSKLLKLYYFR